MSNLLVSEGMPTGHTRLSKWLAQNSKAVAIKYISDLKRNFCLARNPMETAHYNTGEYIRRMKEEKTSYLRKLRS